MTDPDRKKLDAPTLARLRALDAMLGGVAHDLNNALSVVLINLDVMQADPAITAKHGRRIDGMLNAMTGASTLVRYLLSFAHARRPEPDILSIRETLPPLVEVLEAAVGRDIEVVIANNEAGPCCITADPATFEVALVHTAMQLAEAMAGGTITFDLGQGDDSPDRIRLSIEAVPRAGAEAMTDDLDLDFVASFAQTVDGNMTRTALPGGGYRIAISLPAAAEASTL